MILKCQSTVLRLPLGFVRKYLSFVGKYPNVHPKAARTFPLFFTSTQRS